MSEVGDDTLYIGAPSARILSSFLPPRPWRVGLLSRRRWSHLSYDWLKRTTRYLYIILIQLHHHLHRLPTYVISFIIYDSRQIIIIGADARRRSSSVAVIGNNVDADLPVSPSFSVYPSPLSSHRAETTSAPR